MASVFNLGDELRKLGILVALAEKKSDEINF